MTAAPVESCQSLPKRSPFFFLEFWTLLPKTTPRSLGGKNLVRKAHPPSVSRRRKRPGATGHSYQGHAAHCPSLPDSPRGRSARRLLRTSRRRLIGLTLVFASSNCSAGEPDRPIQGFALMLPSPHRYAVGPNETARRPPCHSVDVVQLRRSASCRCPGTPLMMPSRRRAKRDRPPVVELKKTPVFALG